VISTNVPQTDTIITDVGVTVPGQLETSHKNLEAIEAMGTPNLTHHITVFQRVTTNTWHI
jgi:hypothetical protein